MVLTMGDHPDCLVNVNAVGVSRWLGHWGGVFERPMCQRTLLAIQGDRPQPPD